MKTQRDYPVTSEGAEMLVTVDLAEADVASCVIDLDFGIRGRNSFPIWICALRRDEPRQIRQRIKNSHRSVRGKIRRKEAKVKSRFAGGRFRQCGI